MGESDPGCQLRPSWLTRPARRRAMIDDAQRGGANLLLSLQRLKIYSRLIFTLGRPFSPEEPVIISKHLDNILTGHVPPS